MRRVQEKGKQNSLRNKGVPAPLPSHLTHKLSLQMGQVTLRCPPRYITYIHISRSLSIQKVSSKFESGNCTSAGIISEWFILETNGCGFLKKCVTMVSMFHLTLNNFHKIEHWQYMLLMLSRLHQISCANQHYYK